MVFLTVIFLINFIARIILSPLLPTIEKELGISHGQAGSFFFLISAGYVIGLLGSGFLASRSSHRITIVISTAGVGLAAPGNIRRSSLWAMRIGTLWPGVRRRPLYPFGDRDDHVVDRAAALGKSHCRP